MDFRRRAALPEGDGRESGGMTSRVLASAGGAADAGARLGTMEGPGGTGGAGGPGRIEGALRPGGTARAGDALRGSFASYWGRLPATGYESQVVSDMHEDALGDRATRLLLQGADATEERLKLEMPRHAILHLATHGFFQPEGLPSMWEQALDAVDGRRNGSGAAGAGGGMQMTETAARLTGLHPGLLSGLVLAGANRPPDDDATAAGASSDADSGPGADTGGRVDADAATGAPTRTSAATAVASPSTPPPRDDGYLTASEVTLLDLSRVELVVLSACETGLGRPQSGEGLLGLRRAFQMAGARTVISSLWSVDDASTSELMQAFYANLFFRGMGGAEALRAAQLEILATNRREHGEALPSTWGAFVLSGEWR